MKAPAGLALPAIVLIAAALLLGACASAPETAGEAPERNGSLEGKLREAEQLKAQVDEYDLARFSAETYGEAEEKLASGRAKMGEDDAAAERDLDAAIAGYRSVEETGFPRLARALRQEAEDRKAKAESVWAQNAAADEFGRAAAAYRSGTEAEERKSYPDAIDGYSTAATAFSRSYDITLEKRERAARALREAAESLRQVETRSQEIDREIDDLGLPATAQ